MLTTTIIIFLQSERDGRNKTNFVRVVEFVKLPVPVVVVASLPGRRKKDAYSLLGA